MSAKYKYACSGIYFKDMQIHFLLSVASCNITLGAGAAIIQRFPSSWMDLSHACNVD